MVVADESDPSYTASHAGVENICNAWCKLLGIANATDPVPASGHCTLAFSRVDFLAGAGSSIHVMVAGDLLAHATQTKTGYNATFVLEQDEETKQYFVASGIWRYSKIEEV